MIHIIRRHRDADIPALAADDRVVYVESHGRAVTWRKQHTGEPITATEVVELLGEHQRVIVW